MFFISNFIEIFMKYDFLLKKGLLSNKRGAEEMDRREFSIKMRGMLEALTKPLEKAVKRDNFFPSLRVHVKVETIISLNLQLEERNEKVKVEYPDLMRVIEVKGSRGFGLFKKELFSFHILMQPKLTIMNKNISHVEWSRVDVSCDLTRNENVLYQKKVEAALKEEIHRIVKALAKELKIKESKINVDFIEF